jgi:hypothetical protein
VVTVVFQAEAMALLQGTTLRINPSPSPIDLDRSRNVHPAQIVGKPAPMLDLIKMTVSLTVSSGFPSNNASCDKDLAAQLMTEWE